jgi:hypothetical protein
VKERITMTEEEKVIEVRVEEPAEEAEETAQGRRTTTEEIKVQAEDLFETLNGIIREGTARRVTVLRNDRVLVDIPLFLGIGASVILAVYMPVISAVVGVGALLTGCTVRIEREEPSDED